MNVKALSHPQDAAKPVTELDFPSVTICSSGLNMEAVRRALFNDFANWKINNEDNVSHLDDEERVDFYMNETYAMSPGEGNLFETIKEMNSPPKDEDRYDFRAVTNNIISCSKKSGNLTGQTKKESPQAPRRKRSDEGKGRAKKVVIFHDFCH